MKSLNEGLFIAAVLCSTSVGVVDCYQRPASQPTRTSAPPSWEENLLSNGFRPPRRLIPKLFRIENRWEAIELVRLIRGGGSVVTRNEHSSEVDLNGFDRAMRSFCLWLAGVVSWQVMATLAGQREDLLCEVCACACAYDILC